MALSCRTVRRRCPRGDRSGVVLFARGVAVLHGAGMAVQETGVAPPRPLRVSLSRSERSRELAAQFRGLSAQGRGMTWPVRAGHGRAGTVTGVGGTALTVRYGVFAFDPGVSQWVWAVDAPVGRCREI